MMTVTILIYYRLKNITLKFKTMKLASHPRVIERGILTSVYKQEIKQDIGEMKKKSLSRIKTSILNSHDKLKSQTGTVLQVSLFTIVLVIILL
tara:strand:+ start:9643 stop:9921 length:279 start_codon:yes stop_codon:yes gene_type:complete